VEPVQVMNKVKELLSAALQQKEHQRLRQRDFLHKEERKQQTLDNNKRLEQQNQLTFQLTNP